MSSMQLERLKKDSYELGNFIAKLKKKGNTDRAYKLAKKQEFLNQTIVDYNSTTR